MKTLRFSATAMSLIAAPVPAWAQDAAPLQPLSGWEAEQLDDRCIMRRTFGDPAKPMLLELRRIDPWNGGFQAALSSEELKPKDGPIMAGWLPGGREAEVDLPSYEQDERGRYWAVFPHGLWDGALDRLEGERESVAAYFKNGGPERFKQRIEAFHVSGAFEEAITLQTGPMDGVFVAIDDCMKEMLRARGVDPVDMERGDSRVVPRDLQPLQARILSRLPGEIRDRERPSMINFLLYIDDVGRPVSCRLASLPAVAAFEDWGCNLLMKEAAFSFAQGEDKKPTFFKVSLLYRPR